MQQKRRPPSTRHCRPPPALPFTPPRRISSLSWKLNQSGQNDDSLPELSARYLAIRQLERFEEWDNNGAIGDRIITGRKRRQNDNVDQRLDLTTNFRDELVQLPRVDVDVRLSAGSMLRRVDSNLEPPQVRCYLLDEFSCQGTSFDQRRC
jgi:hypothetical protein